MASRRAATASAPAHGGDPAARAVVVFNTLSWPRSGLARISLDFAEPGTPWAGLRDATGEEVPALAEGVTRHEDGTLAGLTLTFRAADVPALGYRTYFVVPVQDAGERAAPGRATSS